MTNIFPEKWWRWNMVMTPMGSNPYKNHLYKNKSKILMNIWSQPPDWWILRVCLTGSTVNLTIYLQSGQKKTGINRFTTPHIIGVLSSQLWIYFRPFIIGAPWLYIWFSGAHLVLHNKSAGRATWGNRPWPFVPRERLGQSVPSPMRRIPQSIESKDCYQTPIP